MYVDQMSVCQMFVGKMSVVQTSDVQMSVIQMSALQMYVDELSISQMYDWCSMCLTKSLWPNVLWQISIGHVSVVKLSVGLNVCLVDKCLMPKSVS